MVRKAARFYLFVFLSSLLLVTLAQFTLAAEWVSISGNVVTEQGTPICAMVLANGQYMFSDQMDGSYDLQVPLDSNGFITLFAFADGFSPFKVILTPPEASNYEVEMAPAAPDTPEMFLSVDFGSAPSHPGWYRIRGKVTNHQETSLCAMVLANGQYMFSNQIHGSYSLEVPLDKNGQITIFAFADGFKPYKEIITYPTGGLSLEDLVGTYELIDFTVTYSNGIVLTPDYFYSYSGTFVIVPDGDTHQTVCLDGECASVDGKILSVSNSSVKVSSAGCVYDLGITFTGNVFTTTFPMGTCGRDYSEVDVWLRTNQSSMSMKGTGEFSQLEYHSVMSDSNKETGVGGLVGGLHKWDY